MNGESILYLRITKKEIFYFFILFFSAKYLYSYVPLSTISKYTVSYICFCRELNVSSSDAIDSDGLAHLVPKGEDARCSNLLLVDLTGCWNVR
jgi:hypothetical protein